MSAHSLLNIESCVALGFLVAVIVRARRSATLATSPDTAWWLVFLILFATVFLTYGRVLGAPFLYDDYTHITDARNATWDGIASAFGPVENPPGLFYRPFGFLVYWLNYLAVGADPRWWHAASLIFHAANCCLLYLLCRRLELSAAGSAGAALVFALSGWATESVAWIDARFDPMATCLVLASLVCVCGFVADGRRWNLATACALAAMAVTTKESAFCLPLLIACLWFFRPANVRRLAMAFLVVGTVATAIFAYRWWALGGIGGYHDPSGAGIEQFSLVRMLNAIFVRDWTILFFPINWSSAPGWILRALLASAPVVFALIVWRVRLPRRVVIGCFAFTTAAALPVEHLLLIGTDLANTRYVYLPAVGWAILWGTIIAQAQAPVRGLVMAWILALEFSITSHNLEFWLRVPEEAKATCAAFAKTVENRAGQAAVVVSGLPQKRDGVVFLANGFPECVAMNGHVPASRVSVAGKPDFVWDPVTDRIVPAK